MKAAIVRAPGELGVEDIPMPKVGEYDVLCRLLYGGTCTGTDLHLIAGEWPWGLKYPFVLGHESIGEVVEIGPKVRNLKPGDRLTRVGVLAPADGSFQIYWGGFAEYGIARDHWAMREDGVDPRQWSGFRIQQLIGPDVDPAAATMMITWRETYNYLDRMGAGKGSRVLVLGSGGNGLAFMAHAANAGAALVAAVGGAGREALARRLGVNTYASYTGLEWPKEVAAACPDGFDIIVDSVGKKGLLDAALPALRPGGMVGIFGMDDYSATAINPRRVRGTCVIYNRGYDAADAHEPVLALMKAGKLRAGDWMDLDHPFPLDRIVDAFAAVRERRMVKAVVKL